MEATTVTMYMSDSFFHTTVFGMIQLILSCVLFGSMFVPLKVYKPGDGMYSQWVMSTAILLVGIGIDLAQGDILTIQPIAMLGGILWGLGNSMTAIILEKLGLALGIFMWNVSSCIVSWAIGTYGFFGVTAQPASNYWLTRLGLACVLGGGIFFTFVKNSDTVNSSTELPKSSSTLSTVKVIHVALSEPESENEKKQTIHDREFYKNKIIGIVCATCSGTLFGFCVYAIVYIHDNFPETPREAYPFLLSYYAGVFVVSSFVFISYSVYKRNNPLIIPQVTLPALISGCIWGIAMALMMNATSLVSTAIVMPIATMLPGCVASLWSVFYFHEINGQKNICILAAGISITVIGSVFIGFSM